MNFLLKNLELELDEKYLLVGEKMLEEGKIKSLYQSERNLWIAETGQFEVEMQVSPSRVRACSCECKTFLDEKMCGHVAAGLLALRRHLSEKKEEPSGKKKAATLYHKLTTTAITDNVSKDDLAAFIRQYAKTNRHFSLALKARFASFVPMQDTKEKYGQLLDAVIAASRKKNDHISILGLRHMAKIVNDLLGQADDAMALKHFTEGMAILQMVIEKLTPVFRKCEGDNTPLIEAINHSFDRLGKLINKPLPPALRTALWDFCINECSRPAYRLNGFSIRFFSILILLSDDKTKAIDFLSVLDAELKRKNIPERYHASLLVSKLGLLEKADMADAILTFTLDLLSSPETLLFAVESARLTGLAKSSKSLGEKGYRLIDDIKIRNRLEEELLQIAVDENDKAAIVKYAASRFHTTKDIAYYRQCKENLEGNRDDFFDNLVGSLEQLPATKTNTETLAALFIEEEKWEKLLNVITQKGSLDLLLQYDVYLISSSRAAVQKLYEQLLGDYLQNHLGMVPARKVQEILAHLHSINAPDLATRLVAFLRKNYPGRIALVEEIAIF